MIKYKKVSPNLLIHDEKIQRVIIFIFTFIILFVICSVGTIPKKYSLRVGDVAQDDIKAPRDFIDEVSTKNKIDKDIANVPLQYNKNVTIQVEAIENLEKYFAKAMEIRNSNLDDILKINKFKSETNIKLNKDDYAATLKLDSNQIKALSDFLVTSLTKILANDIRANTEDDIKKSQEDLSFYLRNSSMSKQMKELGANIGCSLIKPNLYFDSEKTKEMKETIKRQIEPITVKKNQNIVLKGEVVTTNQIELMRQAGLLKEKAYADLTIYLGIAILIGVIESFIFMSVYKFRPNIYKKNSRLFIISIILCINALFTAGLSIISLFLIPVAFTAILIELIFDPFIAYVVSIPSVIVIACITNFNVDIIILYILGCITGIISSNKANQRNYVFLSGITTGIINALVIISVNFINNIESTQGFINSLIGIAGGILSAILAIGILPVFEQIFDINTPIRLLELSDPNQPLLKKMLFEAPGTYHHSILVGNLAEAAAQEVGANMLLARVGSYYHDIGKMKRPYFFKENQITNDNPHDKITPKLSTLIITSHVKDGLELAQIHKLPNEVKNIIQEHHGTTLVKYFYVMAVNEGTEIVDEASFRYEGPRPSSKESAIIMLADSVEAAVRSLGSPTLDAIEKMIDKIVYDKITDGQLIDSDLTLKDIQKTKKAFINVLVGIFHTRIEYPELNASKQIEGEMK